MRLGGGEGHKENAKTLGEIITDRGPWAEEISILYGVGSGWEGGQHNLSKFIMPL